MQHHFDIDIAKEYGLNEAIILNNIQYWIAYNEANKINFHEGCYWTFNSTKSFNEIFPYLSQRQIQNALKNLREQGILKVGNFNKSAYDRTLWYAFTKKGECIMQKCKMENTELSIGLCEKGQPIPNINTVENEDNKPKKERKKETYDTIISQYDLDESVISALYDFIKMRKMIKKPMTDRALKMLINKLLNMTSDPETQVTILENSILKNWTDIYELKGETKHDSNKRSNKRDGSEYSEYD